MRVAIVTESFPPVFNGVANSVVRVLETLKASGHEAIVIAPTTPGKYFNGFRTYRVPSVPFFQFQLGLPNPLVTKILDDFKPDIVHAASPVLLGAQAVSWADRNDVPAIAIFQTDIAAYAERYGFKLLRPMVDRMMANFHAGATINLAPTTEVRDYLVLKFGEEELTLNSFTLIARALRQSHCFVNNMHQMVKRLLVLLEG
jgi:phosphatidylinositol alpha 1,6-mannosyltransferase